STVFRASRCCSSSSAMTPLKSNNKASVMSPLQCRVGSSARKIHRRLARRGDGPADAAPPSGVVAGRLVRLVQQLDRMAGLGGYTGGGEGGAELHEAAGVSRCDDLRGRVAQRRKLRHEHGA